MLKTRISLIITLLILTTLLTACNAQQKDEAQPPELFPTPLPYVTSPPSEPITGKLVCADWIDYDFLGPRIFLTDLSTGIVQQLTVEDTSQPKWSPDGKQIAYLSFQDGNLNIYMMNADGSAKRRLTDHPGYDAQINWSPDGEKIIFVSDRDGEDNEIYTLTVSTGEINRLTFNDHSEGDPVWASNGDKIAFVSWVPEHGLILFVMDSDGRNIKQLPYSKYGNFHGPTWCPDDSCLIYVHEVSTMFYEYEKIFIYDIETGKEKRLISRWPTSSNIYELNPSFTKDGQYLLIWLDGNVNGLYVLDMKEDEIRSLGVEGGSCDFYPDPSP